MEDDKGWISVARKQKKVKTNKQIPPVKPKVKEPVVKREDTDLESDIERYHGIVKQRILDAMKKPSNLGGFKRASYEFEVTKENRREAFLILGPQNDGEAYFDRMGTVSLIDRLERDLGDGYSLNVSRVGPTTSAIDVYWNDIAEINKTIENLLEYIMQDSDALIESVKSNVWANWVDIFEHHIDRETQTPEEFQEAKMISMFLRGNRVQRLGVFTDIGVEPLIDRIQKRVQDIEPEFTVAYKRIGKTNKNVIRVFFNRRRPWTKRPPGFN